MTLFQCVNHQGKRIDFHIAHLAQLSHIIRKVGFFDVHGLIGSPCWNHLDFKAAIARNLVPMQIIYGVISCAHTFHMITSHQASGTILRLFQFLIALIKNFTGRAGTQEFINAEGCLQFQMGPMIQGITEGVRHCLRPLLKLLPIGGVVTRAIFLSNTVSAHGTPFVMIASQPQFSDASKLMVFGYHLRHQMTMIVDDGHLGRVIVKQILRGRGLQQEVFVHKCFHSRNKFDCF